MPWKSDQQRKWGHTPEGEKALGGKAAVHEWDEASKGKKLPERKMKKSKKHKMAETHIKHHHDGSHTKTHKMDDGSELTSAHPDDADMMSQMQGALAAPQEAAPAAAPAAPAPPVA
jgi:hypothetical protein